LAPLYRKRITLSVGAIPEFESIWGVALGFKKERITLSVGAIPEFESIEGIALSFKKGNG
jgi:hypothetical protein